MPESIASNFQDGLFKEFAKYLPKEDREDLKSLSNMYEIEMAAVKKSLIDDLYTLRAELHPQLLYTTGDDGTLNEIDWLLEHKERVLKPPAKSDKSNNSLINTPDSILPVNQAEANPNSDTHFLTAYSNHINRLSNTFANMLFGYYMNDLFEAELPYNITSSAFKNMGFGTSVFEDEEGGKRVGIDLSDIGLELFAYKFVPWTDPLEKSLGKSLNEGIVKGTNGSADKYYVDMGLKPEVFSFISTAVTTPIHEIVHNISSHYTSRAYSTSIEKVFKNSFKDFKKYFSVTRDHGVLFGNIDEDLSKQLSEKGIELRGKDLIDPFVLWEITKRHGQQIADIIDQPVDKFQNAAYDYLSNYLPFRIVEDGIAINLTLNNAGIDEIPAKLKGLDKSVKNLIKFGVDLERFQYLTRGVDFYTGEKMMASYYLPELQLYPVSYLYIADLASKQNNMGAKSYFQMASNVYRQKNLVKFGSPDFRKIQKELREILSTNGSRSSVRAYNFTRPIVASPVSAPSSTADARTNRTAIADDIQQRHQSSQQHSGTRPTTAEQAEPRQNPRIRTRGDGSNSNRRPSSTLDYLDDSADSSPSERYELESFIYDIEEIGSYLFGNDRSSRNRSRRCEPDIRHILLLGGARIALRLILDRCGCNG